MSLGYKRYSAEQFGRACSRFGNRLSWLRLVLIVLSLSRWNRTLNSHARFLLCSIERLWHQKVKLSLHNLKSKQLTHAGSSLIQSIHHKITPTFALLRDSKYTLNRLEKGNIPPKERLWTYITDLAAYQVRNFQPMPFIGYLKMLHHLWILFSVELEITARETTVTYFMMLPDDPLSKRVK